MIYIAVDPGESTGICVYYDIGRYKLQTLDWYGLVEWVYSSSESALADHWIVEAFHLMPNRTGPKTFSSFPEIEVIGLIRGCATHQRQGFMTVTPGEYKPFGNKIPIPDNLGRLDKHQKDAYRLLQYALRFKKIVPTVQGG